MKKLFFTFVLLAAVATSFMSCENGNIYTVNMTGLTFNE